MRFNRKTALLLLLLPSILYGQVINTVAGNGTVGYSGDNGPATAACLTQPRDVVADRYGNLFFY